MAKKKTADERKLTSTIIEDGCVKKIKNYEKVISIWPWMFLILILLFVAFVRIRLLQMPLERDEGEFAYIGQLMLQGIPPYLLAYSMKLPGIYAAYALIMAVFGKTIGGIHSGLLVINALSVVLIFFLSRRLFGDTAGIVSAAGYAILSLWPSVLGTSAHATHFIVPCAVGGTLLLLKAEDKNSIPSLFASGLLFGLAFIIKQHAIFFILFAVLYYTVNTISEFHPGRWRYCALRLGVLVLAILTPYVIIFILLYEAGVFERFWFWTVTYARQYVSFVPLSEVPERFLMRTYLVIKGWELYWFLAALGLFSIIWDRSIRAQWRFLLSFTFFSFMTIVPGYFFRNHYYITVLPAVTLCAGAAVHSMSRFMYQWKKTSWIKVPPVVLVAVILVYPIFTHKEFFFKAPPTYVTRMIYGNNPLYESIEIGEFIKNNTSMQDSIVVFGSEPQIYFYADRKAASGHIYVYSLMESQDYSSQMQLEMIREVELNRPKYAVFVNNAFSWLLRKDSDKGIIMWAKRYLADNYRTVGILSRNDNGPLGYTSFWGEKISMVDQTVAGGSVFVLERESGPGGKGNLSGK